MTYVMSDVHGCYDEFCALLEKINFSEKDELYILGDIVDRGPRPIDIIEMIMDMDNVHMLMGNHEHMMVMALMAEDPAAIEDWKFNGNKHTLNQLLALDENRACDIVGWISTRPLLMEIEVNGQAFVLSHAGINPKKTLSKQNWYEVLWSREEFYRKKASKSQKKFIFGHTPTPHIDGSSGVWVDPKYKDKIGIDCGCYGGGALAALRLEDGEVFYQRNLEEKDELQLGPTKLALSCAS